MLDDLETFTDWINQQNRETMRMDPDSSPGIPWHSAGSTNGEIFDYVPGFGYNKNRLEELRLAVKQRLVELEVGSALDPISLFIKQEYHKQKKADEERWRLISSVGLTDQIVARMLFEPFFDYVLARPMQFRMAIGWGLTAPGSLTFMNAHIGPDPVEAADKSAWDWTVQPWLFDVFYNICLALFDSRDDRFKTIMRHHLRAICYDKVFDINGRRYRQELPGIMPSGWFMTILFNSVSQLILHAYADDGDEFAWPLVMGDDTIQPQASPQYWDRIRKTGCILKELSNERDFCGFNFSPEAYLPVYGLKYDFAIHHIEPSVLKETLASFQWLYAFVPQQLSSIQRYIREIGYADLVVRPQDMQRRVLGLPVRMPRL
ncbi:hypothetical protein 2 [Beihai sobemo-like virus 13]|uniref:hypothetical protein 2 n=1 Tax=Beihai sobemo-like virus 13 TaxID=1922684 RepID=UPI00090A0408|nr:hypothetical protein 2 [Beihai sobemo-like virus 13]APG75965.1 hypothetical protein 2 [Beihai sobemo-like virus 13]